MPRNQRPIAFGLLSDDEHVEMLSECDVKYLEQRHRDPARGAILLDETQQGGAAGGKRMTPARGVVQSERRKGRRLCRFSHSRSVTGCCAVVRSTLRGRGLGAHHEKMLLCDIEVH